MKDKILTLHPQGKKGVNISRQHYETIKDFITKTVSEHGSITYQRLDDLANEKLTDFDGSVSWYVVTVKLDLEARGILERIPKTSPHQVRLKQ